MNGLCHVTNSDVIIFIEEWGYFPLDTFLALGEAEKTTYHLIPDKLILSSIAGLLMNMHRDFRALVSERNVRNAENEVRVVPVLTHHFMNMRESDFYKLLHTQRIRLLWNFTPSDVEKLRMNL